MAELRVLGTVEVVDGADRVDVGGQRPLRILTALAEAGAPLSLDQIADRAWPPGHQPEDPTRAIRMAVSRLRSALGDDAIVTRAGGYEVAGVDLDTGRFEALVAAGRAAADPVAAERTFRDALGLWRGSAFGGLEDLEWLDAERRRLDELHLVALEGWYDAKLRVGSTTELIPALEGSVGEHPLRDRFQRQLMLALYRSGRQAEALRAFQEYRSELAGAGLEPPTESAELERLIATGDSSLNEAEQRSLRGYRIVERLGEGAFSIVYRGTQPSVGREVAIKQIRAELANRPEFIRRFEAEAHMVAAIEHPYIVPLIDYWREPGSAYLVMRLLRGGSLESAVLEGGWPLDKTTRMVEQIGAALEAAHGHGIVHRDVKSANVLLDEAGNAYLTDFGIALEAAEAADPDASLSAGSPAYASPEQLRREPVGPQADVHGLAIVTYEALAGRLPFPDEPTQAALLQRQLHDPIPPVRNLRSDVPAQLDDVLQRATAKDANERYETVGAFVAAFRDAAGVAAEPSRRGAATTISGTGRNPYKGLRAFGEADAADFAGRQRLVDQLLDVLDRRRVVTVVGPSGSGKSSVVRAGLLPALGSNRIAGSSRWFRLTMVPGERPFEELEDGLVRLAVDRPAALLDVLRDGERGIGRAIRRVLPEGGELLLVIDQFEELFTLCPDEDTRRAFLDGLASALTEERARLRVVFTLRADFFDRPLRYESIGRLVKDSTVPVLPLAADELEHAIVDPAHGVGAEFEPGLVSELVADVADQPGALPMLQYALTELYDRRVSDFMTRDAYRDLGGVAGALAARAEQLYSGADDEQQIACRRVFEQLVALGEGVEDTRRRALRSEAVKTPAAGAVVDRYGAARLLSFDRDPATREPTIEVAHEALIREWPRLGEWIDEDREDLRIQRHLQAAAVDWDRAGRPDAELYRGGRLESAEAWRADHAGDASAVENAFVDAAVALRDATREGERRQVRRFRTVAVVAGVVAVIALVAGLVAIREQRTARSAESEAVAARNDAETARVAAEQATFNADVRRMVAEAPIQLETNEGTALLLALEAHRLQPSNQTLGALQRVLVGLPAGWLGSFAQGRGHLDIEASQSAGVLVGAGPNGLDVFSLDGWSVIASLPGSFGVVAISADGEVVAAGGADGTFRVFERDGLLPAFEASVGSGVVRLAFDSSGSRLAVGAANGTVSVFDVSDGESAVVGSVVDAATELEWSPDDGMVLVSGSERAAARVFAADGSGQVGPDLSVEWADTGNAGATNAVWVGGDPVVINGAVVRFDLTTGQALARRVDVRLDIRQRGWARALDENRLVAANVNGEVSIVDFTLEEVATVADLNASSTDIEFVDGQLFALNQNDIDVQSLVGSRLIAQSIPASPGRPLIAATDDGRFVTSGFFVPLPIWDIDGDPPDRAIVVEDAVFPRARGDLTILGTPGTGFYKTWSEAEGLRQLPLPGDPTGIYSVAGLSPDGSLIVLPTRGEEESEIHVVDRATGDLIVSLTELADAIPETEIRVRGTVIDVEFTPDGTRMLATTPGGHWGIWDTETWDLVEGIHSDNNAGSDVSFSPDGALVAVLQVNGTLSVRPADDLSTVLRSVSAHEGIRFNGEAVAWTADGRYLMTDGDLGAKFWDAQTLEVIGGVFPHVATIQSAELAPLGERLVTQVGDEVLVWNVDFDSWVDIACAAVGRNMTSAEWERFGPEGLGYQTTCPQWPAETDE